MPLLIKHKDERELGTVPSSLSLLICAATSWETHPIADVLGLAPNRSDSFSGTVNGVAVFLLKTGIGETSLQRSLETIPQGIKFSRIISTGFCGGLKSNIDSGDIVCDFGSVHPDATEQCRQIAIEKAKVHFGSLAHSSIVLASSDLKKSLAKNSASLAVDMETAPLRVWAKEKFPAAEVWGIRAVLDALEDRLPSGMPPKENLLSQIFYALSHPMDWPLFLKIYFKQKKASETLTQFLSQLIGK